MNSMGRKHTWSWKQHRYVQRSITAVLWNPHWLHVVTMFPPRALFNASRFVNGHLVPLLEKSFSAGWSAARSTLTVHIDNTLAHSVLGMWYQGPTGNSPGLGLSILRQARRSWSKYEAQRPAGKAETMTRSSATRCHASMIRITFLLYRATTWITGETPRTPSSRKTDWSSMPFNAEMRYFHRDSCASGQPVWPHTCSGVWLALRADRTSPLWASHPTFWATLHYETRRDPASLQNRFHLPGTLLLFTSCKSHQLHSLSKTYKQPKINPL
jgi:hypothetical protein